MINKGKARRDVQCGVRTLRAPWVFCVGEEDERGVEGASASVQCTVCDTYS